MEFHSIFQNPLPILQEVPFSFINLRNIHVLAAKTLLTILLPFFEYVYYSIFFRYLQNSIAKNIEKQAWRWKYTLISLISCLLSFGPENFSSEDQPTEYVT